MPGPRLVPQQGFALGLNLRDGPDAVEAAHAIDALNVIFRERGTVASRPGSTLRRELPGQRGEPQYVEGYESGDVNHVLVGYEDELQMLVEGVGATHAALANSGGLGATAHFYTTAKVGSLTSEQVWVASDGCQVRRVAATVATSPTISIDGAGAAGNHGNGTVVGVTPWDSRLLLGGFRTGCVGPGGQAVDRSKVFACDPADPLSLQSDSYFRVGVGDGEDVMAIVTWREQVFIFKESRFWVMSGISTDESGGPLFQRRPVEAGVGAASPAGVSVGRDGVYFLARNGKVYRTTGGAPQSISDLVEPILDGRGSRYFRGRCVIPGNTRLTGLHWNDELLYVNYQPDDDVTLRRARQLVYDTRFGWWSLYDLPASAVGTARDGALLFADTGEVAAPENYLWRLDDASIGDGNGLISTLALRPFDARWRSGWADFQNPEVKVHAAVRAWGAGRPNLRVSRDFREFFESTRVLELGGNPETWHDGSVALDTWGDGTPGDLWGPVAGVDGVMSRHALAHSHLSFQLDGRVGLGVGDPFSVHRLTHYVRESNAPDATRVHR